MTMTNPLLSRFLSLPTPRVHVHVMNVQVLHIQNPEKVQAFQDVVEWLKESTGAKLEGVSMDEFRVRLSEAVEEKGPQDVGVLAQVWIH